MPRGRQYYDPITQVPGTVPAADDLSRIELYPEVVGDVITRWCARRIHADGSVADEIPGSADHDEVLARSQATWPGLMVYELKSEGEDSTHEGMGPSPRLWQGVSPQMGFPGERLTEAWVEHVADTPTVPPAVEEKDAIVHRLTENVQSHPDGARQLRAIVAADPGAYVHLDDIVLVLEDYAAQYDEQGNPSGALALREAAAALREPF